MLRLKLFFLLVCYVFFGWDVHGAQRELDFNEEGVRWKVHLPVKMRETLCNLVIRELEIGNFLKKNGDKNVPNQFSAAVLLYKKGDTCLKNPIGPFYFSETIKDIGTNLTCVSGTLAGSMFIKSSKEKINLSGLEEGKELHEGFTDLLTPDEALVDVECSSIVALPGIEPENIADQKEEHNIFPGFIDEESDAGDMELLNKIEKKVEFSKCCIKKRIESRLSDDWGVNVGNVHYARLKLVERYLSERRNNYHEHSEQYFLYHLLFNKSRQEEFSFKTDCYLNLGSFLEKIKSEVEDSVIDRFVLLGHSSNDMCVSCTVSFAREYASDKEDALCQVVRRVFNGAQVNIVIASRKEESDLRGQLSRRINGRDQHQNHPVDWDAMWNHRLIVQCVADDVFFIWNTPKTSAISDDKVVAEFSESVTTLV